MVAMKESEGGSATEPLLNSSGKQIADWAQDYYAGAGGDGINEPRNPASVEVDAAISAHEIRSASHSNPYPLYIHGPLLSPPSLGPPAMHYTPQHSISKAFGSVWPLDEREIRELLIDHVGHRFCWGSNPARKWKIQAVEDCNAYVGTLETFIEERDVIIEVEPHAGGHIDGTNSGAEPGPWELDLRSEFPLLFVSRKEARVKIPRSETIHKCSGCDGRGEVPCTTCNASTEPGFYNVNKIIVCTACHGRGLIAHADGSDTICGICKGEGRYACPSCQSRGLVKCQKCRGEGSLLNRKICVVRCIWEIIRRTLSTRKVNASCNAASVPDDVFHRAKGVQLWNSQAYQCQPTDFIDSPTLNKFSSDIIADRNPVPPTARIICERHQITVVPVTRVIMTHHNSSFAFYLIGLSKEIFVKDYPARCCWGLCCCLS